MCNSPRNNPVKLHVNSSRIGGALGFFRFMTSSTSTRSYDVTSKIGLRQSMRNSPRNNPVKLHVNPSRNGGALDCFVLWRHHRQLESMTSHRKSDSVSRSVSSSSINMSNFMWIRLELTEPYAFLYLWRHRRHLEIMTSYRKSDSVSRSVSSSSIIMKKFMSIGLELTEP
jgi:hypothetical protein